MEVEEAEEAEEAEERVSQKKSYGHCARSGCLTSNVSGIPKKKESKTSSMLEAFGPML